MSKKEKPIVYRTGNGVVIPPERMEYARRNLSVIYADNAPREPAWWISTGCLQNVIIGLVLGVALLILGSHFFPEIFGGPDWVIIILEALK